MKQFVACLVVLMMCVSVASAAIDDENSDWLIYLDPFGDTVAERYDQYMEVLPGESFTLYIVVNRNPPFGYTLVRDYISEFWYNPAVIENYPQPDYTYAMPDYMNPAGPTGWWSGGWVQLLNQSWTGRYMYELPAETPYVALGWDFTIRSDAPLGATTLPMKFRTYNMTGCDPYNPDRNLLNNLETDPAFTINVVAPAPFPPGDYDGDYDIDADDIDLLADAIEAGSTDLTYDVNGDSLIDEADMIQHVATLVERTDGGVGTYRGDFNLDGYVDGTDLAILKAGFGLSGLGYALGNANADDFVNGTDLAIFKATFGFSGTPGGLNPPAVPEPATLSLLGLGAAALLRRRK